MVTEADASPARRALPAACFLAALFALLAARPLLHGANVADVGRVLAFEIAYVIVPGACAWRALRPRREDWLFELGASWALGHIVECLVSVLLTVTGATALFPFFPFLVVGVVVGLLVPLALWPARRAVDRALFVPSRAPPRWIESGGLLVLLAIAIERVPMSGSLFDGLDPDVLFHAGNAAEYAHRWPLRDPRVFGEPLCYHFFAYALPAGCERVTGVPILESVMRSQAALVTVVLLLQVHNFARTFTARPLGALAGTALVALHANLGFALDRWSRAVGVDVGTWSFDSPLGFGLYKSTSTAYGLLVFTTLAIALRRYLQGEGGKRALVLVGLCSACASGAKGSLMPVAIAALVATVLVELVRCRSLPNRDEGRARLGRSLSALAVCVVCAAPMTLYLAFGAGSYASAMFRWDPGQVVHASSIAGGGVWERWIRPGSGEVWRFVFVLPWLFGYFGPALVGCIHLVLDRGRKLDASGIWTLATVVVGFVAAWCLAAPGISQLFFLYPGQVLMGALAGPVLVEALARHRLGDRVAWIASAVLLVPFAWAAALELETRIESEPSRSLEAPLEREYEDGLRWIRTNTSPRAVFVVRHDRMFLSAFGERRTLFETWQFLPAFHALRPRDRAGAQRLLEHLRPDIETRDAIFGRADRAAFDRARALLAGEDVYVLWDAVQFVRRPDGLVRAIVHEPEKAPDFAAEELALVLANRAMRLYRLVPRP